MTYLIAPRNHPAARLGEPQPRPQTQIPRDARERYQRELRNAINSNAVVQAIRRLPEGRVCPAPEHMAAYEQRIREKLRGSFAYPQLEAGINLWRVSMGYPPRPDPMQQPPLPRQTGMRATEPGERERSARYTAELLEQRYVLAQRTGNVEGMVKAAEDYYQLLGGHPHGPGSPLPGRGSMARDRESWLEAREDLLRRAPSLAQIVRHLGPLALRDVRGQIRSHVTQRHQRPQVRRR